MKTEQEIRKLQKDLRFVANKVHESNYPYKMSLWHSEILLEWVLGNQDWFVDDFYDKDGNIKEEVIIQAEQEVIPIHNR